MVSKRRNVFYENEKEETAEVKNLAILTKIYILVRIFIVRFNIIDEISSTDLVSDIPHPTSSVATVPAERVASRAEMDLRQTIVLVSYLALYGFTETESKNLILLVLVEHVSALGRHLQPERLWGSEEVIILKRLTVAQAEDGVLAPKLALREQEAGDDGNRFKGQAEIMLTRAGDCRDRGTGDLVLDSNMISKANRTTHVYSTNMFLRVPLDDDIKVLVDVSYLSNGRWVQNFLKQNMGGVCTTLKTVAPSIFEVLISLNNNKGCPIPPGTYRVKDLNAKHTFVWPFVPVGTYRVLTKFTKDSNLIGCKIYYMRTTVTE
ncbi:hypothetical protein AAG570_006102 [Ranatra chinensis]|uniref:Uncharacterized protein n=1 Tax=Ranatra chinensis TaxID=642074 RepID=A0ABD0XY38_9HEMI